jgi:hypothetical protein
MQTVSRGSPVDRPWSVPGMIVSNLRHGRGLAPKDSPLTLQDVMARADYRDLMTPKVAEGDRAPDFELARLDGEGSIRLASLLAERPAALVFGSYTWPPFRAQVGTLEELAERYRDRVAFLGIYIREAHPEDGWILPENRRSGVAVREPKTDEERRAVASMCAINLRMRMPMVVDGADNPVASAYGGWPDRLYLVRRDGRIVFQSGEGPFGFKPEELERAIEREVALAAAWRTRDRLLMCGGSFAEPWFGSVVGGFISVFFAWVLGWPDIAGYLAILLGALIGGFVGLEVGRRSFANRNANRS